MTVFSTYNKHSAGGFLNQSHPNVHVYPWFRQQAVRPGQIRPELAQPHERAQSYSGPTVTGSPAQKQAAAKIMGTTLSSSGGGCGCKGRK
jgi:hypothetical protein